MADRGTSLMWKQLLKSVEGANRPLQMQVRELLVLAIGTRMLKPGDAVPSSRELSATLGVARNTVVLAYDQLVDQGILFSRQRSGYYVNPDYCPPAPQPARDAEPVSGSPRWPGHLKMRPSEQRNIMKPRDWQSYPYPFLYGQFDATLFPIADWRECGRQALSMLDVCDWAPDLLDADDATLVEQLRTRVLPRRGIVADASEIVITVGAQQALFLISELLTDRHSVVGIEEPGYPDARNIFQLKGRTIRPLAIDDGGLVTGAELRGCDLVLATPSHQCPTTRTMPLDRREALLDDARRYDFLVIEDDYDSEMDAFGGGTPALKSLDRNQRVIYISSFSKILAPGLRLGFIVAPAELAREIRALRRLMVRHPALNNQRAAALFLSLGHYDSSMRRRAEMLRERAEILAGALRTHLPELDFSCDPGASSAWVRGPEGFDARRFADIAQARGVLIEPGDVFFYGAPEPSRYFRLGFSSIRGDRIEAGIKLLAELIHAETGVAPRMAGATNRP